VRKGYGFALGEAVSSVGAHHVRGAVLAEEGWVARAIPDQVAEEMFGSKEAKNPHSPIAKDRTVRWYERITTMADSLGLCKFVLSPYAGQKLITLKDLAELLSQASGLSFTEKDFERATERILALERAFNVREGFSRKDDGLPPRMWEPVAGGPKKGFQLEKELFEQALTQYYALHGWNEEGIPTPETLESLNLKFIGEQLERLGKYGKG
jgi:aldehyde:ferredoxin oxidoreductase